MGQIDDNEFTIKEDGTIKRGEKIDRFKKKIVEKTDYTEEKESAGPVGIIISFLLPVIGLIWYFIMKEKVYNPKAYLYSAVIGLIINFVLPLFFS